MSSGRIRLLTTKLCPEDMPVYKLRPVVILILFTFLRSMSVAQSNVTVPVLEKAYLSVDSLRLALSLTSEQTYLVSMINQKYIVRFDSIRISDDDRFVKYTKAILLRRQRDDELKFLLSEKQFRIYYLAQDTVRRSRSRN